MLDAFSVLLFHSSPLNQDEAIGFLSIHYRLVMESPHFTANLCLKFFRSLHQTNENAVRRKIFHIGVDLESKKYKEPLTCNLLSQLRALLLGQKQKLLLILLEMGKVICSELNEGNGLDLMRLLMALVIALTLMAICIPPPPRRAIVVARRIV